MNLTGIYKFFETANIDSGKVIGLSILIIVYFLAKRVSPTSLMKLINQSHIKTTLASLITSSSKVNKILEDTLFEYNADRCYVFQYHNGGVNTAGIPFAKCSNTHERCEVGVASHMKYYQNLPIGMYGFRHDTIVKGHTVIVVDPEELKATDKSGYNLLKTLGIKSLYVTGIFSHDNCLIGFLGIDYVRDSKRLEVDNVARFEKIAQAIGGCLERLD